MSYWKDKVALVTGGSAGFGWALAQVLADAGAKLALADIDEQRLAAAVDQLRERGCDVEGLSVDVTQPAQVDALVQQVVERFGRLDMLANIVGRSARGALLDTTPEAFRDLFELNFLSMVHCTRASASHLIESKGHVVNMGSLAAKSASRFLGAYPASKFPVAAYSQQLRYELGPQGLHVLLVCPGPIARQDAGHRYDDQAEDLPDSARRPGGGVKLKGIPPAKLAAKVLRACEKRVPELVMPAKARLLFAILQLWPSLGDRILKRMTDARS
jgi:NAD(P)-dependent dehydrogenase (short-subunit alcohol dehydrogenase family)